MQGRHSALHIALDDATRTTLQGWLRKQKTPVALAKRAHTILLLADGQTFAATARHVELRGRHVRKWALRFVASGIDGLYDKKRPGRRPVFSPGLSLTVPRYMNWKTFHINTLQGATHVSRLPFFTYSCTWNFFASSWKEVDYICFHVSINCQSRA